jgi:hypothetical protein
VPKNGLATISAPLASSPDEIVRKALVVFSEICQRDITPALVAIWVEQLSDIPPQRLNEACKRLAKTWRSNFLPTPGNVRAQLDDAEGKGFELAGEREWQKLLEWVRANVFPDTGIRRGAPRLTPQVELAAKAAGGVFYLERCDDDQLVWCRKSFLAAYKNVHEAGQVEHLLGDGAAKQILRQLSNSPRPARKSIAPESVSEKPSAGEVREFLKTVCAEQPRPIASESAEVLAANWRSQKERLAARCAELGIPAPADSQVASR